MTFFAYNQARIPVNSEGKVHGTKLLAQGERKWKDYKKLPSTKVLIKKLEAEHGKGYAFKANHTVWVCMELAKDMVKWLKQVGQEKTSVVREDEKEVESPVVREDKKEVKTLVVPEDQNEVKVREDEKMVQENLQCDMDCDDQNDCMDQEVKDDCMDQEEVKVQPFSHLLKITVEDLKNAGVRITENNRWISTYDAIKCCKGSLNVRSEWTRQKEGIFVMSHFRASRFFLHHFLHQGGHLSFFRSKLENSILQIQEI